MSIQNRYKMLNTHMYLQKWQNQLLVTNTKMPWSVNTPLLTSLVNVNVAFDWSSSESH